MVEIAMKGENAFHKVVPMLQTHIALIKQKLEEVPEIKIQGYQISVEAWANDNGIALGAVSCSKSATDDAVELTIDVKRRQEYIELWMGIYWSTGQVIKDISDIKIHEKDGNEIGSKIKKFLETYCQISVEYLVDFLLSKRGAI
jgi:hypothetical protein